MTERSGPRHVRGSSPARAPVLQHVAMGQYGIVIVSPKNGYPTDKEIDREYAVVQSEFYLKPNDEDPEGLWVFDMDAAQRKAPSQVLFNGSTRALTEPGLLANAGERVRLYVHNVGPNDQSSLHIIGVIFDRVFFEAAGGESATADFRAPRAPGTYPYVCSYPGHYNGGMKGTLVVK